MSRSPRFPLVAICLAMACAERATDPEPSEPQRTEPSFQQSQGRQECVGTLPPGTYKNVYVPPGAFCNIEGIGTFTIIEGNLLVYEGAFLNMEAVRVLGNLKLMKDSRTNVINSFIGGNIDGNQINTLDAGSASVIEGNVFIKNSSAADTRIDLAVIEVMNGDIRIMNNNGAEIEVDFVFVHNGSIDIRKNTVTDMLVRDNDVAQDVRIVQNDVLTSYLVQGNIVRGNMDVLDNQSPTATVSLNTVEQTLRCFNNTVVFIGGPNVAANAEGQCFVATP